MLANEIDVRHCTHVGLTAAATTLSTTAEDRDSVMPSVWACGGVEGINEVSLGPACSDAMRR
jgi:hypothetical protein